MGKVKRIKTDYTIKNVFENQELKESKVPFFSCFVDRENYRNDFWYSHYIPMKNKIENGVEQNKCDIIHFYGDPGVGKTALINKLKKEMDEQSPNGQGDYLYFDFHGFSGELYDLIQKLILDLRKKFKFEFPLTEYASMKISVEFKDTAPLSRSFRDVIQNNRGVGLIRTIIKRTSLGNIIYTITDVIDYIEKNYDIGFVRTIKKQLQDKAFKESVNYMRKMNASHILEKIHVFFAIDLKMNLIKRGKPFVIFLDTFDQYICVNETQQKEKDWWLRNHNDGIILAVPNVIWVIASRSGLDKVENVGLDSWKSFEIDEQKINFFDKDNSIKLVKSEGLSDCEVDENFSRISKCSPFFLNLLVQLFYSIEPNTLLKEGFFSNTCDFTGILKYYFSLFDLKVQKLISVLALFEEGWSSEMILKIREKLPYFVQEIYEQIIHNKILVIHSKENDCYFIISYLKNITSNVLDEAEKQEVYQIIMNYYANNLDRNTSPYEQLNKLIKFTLVIEAPYEIFCSIVLKYLIDLVINIRLYELNQLLCIYENSEIYKYKKNYELYLSIFALRNIYNNLKTRRIDEDSLAFMISALSNQDIDMSTRCILCMSISYEELLKGRFLEAIDYGMKIQNIVIQDKERLISISAIANEIISNGYLSLWEYKKGLQLGRDGYEMRKILFGKNHWYTLSSLCNISKALYGLGNFKQAYNIDCYGYNNAYLSLGESHPLTLLFLERLAEDLSQLGDYYKAYSYKERIMEIRESLFGKNSPQFYSSLYAIAVAHSYLGDFKGALNLKRKVYSFRREVEGEKHPQTINSLYGIGVEYSKLGQSKEALKYKKKAYEMRVIVLGRNHFDTISAYFGIGEDLLKLGNISEAQKIFQETLENKISLLGEMHPDVLSVYYQIAIAYYKAGALSLAWHISLTTLRKRKKIFGGLHPMVFASSYLSGKILMAMKRYSHAYNFFKSAYEGALNVLGILHPDTEKYHNAYLQILGLKRGEKNDA